MPCLSERNRGDTVPPPKYGHGMDPGAEQMEKQTLPEVTQEEVMLACKKVGVNTAPGPDGIPNKALKIAITRNPQIFAEVMQTCLEKGSFPTEWKRQRLVLLPKEGKTPNDRVAYRPV